MLQYLRKYIKNLQADQLESYILSGECTLHAIELEPDAIADWIADILPFTVEIQKVFCSKVNIKIPWAQVKTKPVQIAIQQMEVTLLVHDFREQEWAVQQAREQKNKLVQSRIFELGKVINPEKVLKQLELTWIDYVSAGVQVRAEFCKLNLLSSSPSRIPPATSPHTCTSTAPPLLPQTGSPDIAFSIDIEGLFMAPCHHHSGWSVNYVDNPDQVYEYDANSKNLRLSRLVTLKSFAVSGRRGGDAPIITHNPGFRMRLSSEFTCINLSKTKHKRRFCIPPFPSASNSAIWMDRVNVSAACSCELASLYAILQDLLAPVVVPAECVLPADRPCHYSYEEEEILKAKNSADLEKYLSIVPEPVAPVESPPPEPSVTPQFPVEQPQRSKTKTGVIRGPGRTDMRKLFFGLAREVQSNATKVTEQAQQRTDKIVSQSKKIFTSAISTLTVGKKAVKDSLSATTHPVVGGVQSPTNRPSPPAALVVDTSPTNTIGSSPSRRSRRGSSAYSASGDESDYFVDAVSGDDDDDGASTTAGQTTSAAMAAGNADGFAVWLSADRSDGGEFDLESQFVVLDKICYKSIFHIHLNELGLVVSASADTVSVIVRKLDLTAESQTPLTFTQLSTIAAFSQSPDLFIKQARALTANVLCPTEPVHSSTAVSAASVQVTVTPPSSSSLPQVEILKISSKDGLKALAMKWKSRSPPPTRLIKVVGTRHEVEKGRIQPYEGCIHGMKICVEQWSPFLSVYNQCMEFAGEFPDQTLDPVMRLRMCVRDTEVITTSGWRIAVPNSILTRNITKSSHLFADLLGGFQTLSPVPDCHYTDTTQQPTSSSPTQTGFPFDGSFVSCICGQETTSWSWALPTTTTAGSHYPAKVKLPGRQLGANGTVTERTWKKSQLESDEAKFVYVPIDEFGSLLETKLKVAEQQVLIDQLREQYNTVMEDMTKRNIFLKERWAAEAVQTGSKESVIDILTQKVCVMETYVRELAGEKEASDKSTEELRTVAGGEIAAARKELLEQTQTLKFKIADGAIVHESLTDLIATKEKEIHTLKHQREFLLGLGVKATGNAAVQTGRDSQEGTPASQD